MNQNAITPLLEQSQLQLREQNSPGVSLFQAGMNGLGANVSFPYLDATDNTVKTTNSLADWVTLVGEYVMANPLIGLGIAGVLLVTVFGGTYAGSGNTRKRN